MISTKKIARLVAVLGCSTVALAAAPASQRDPLAEAPADDHAELLLIAARSSLLTALVNQPISDMRPISEYVQGTIMQGTALTQGVVTAAPFASQAGLGLMIIFNSQTNAWTANTNSPRPDIDINFDWTISTTAATSKGILLREDGFALYSAQTNAYSNITIQSLSADASGLGWRFKEAIAERRAWEMLEQSRAQHEAEAASKIASELNSTIDTRVYDMLLPFHYKFYEYVYAPLVQGGLLGGHIGGGSDGEWLALQGTRSQDVQAVDVQALGLPSYAYGGEGEHLVLRVDQDLLMRIAEQKLGGTYITDNEIADLTGRSTPSDDSFDDVLGVEREEVAMVFDEKKPVLVAFDNDQIKLTFRLETLTTLDRTLHDVQVSRVIHIVRGDGTLQLRSEAFKNASFYSGAPVEASLAKHITEHMSQWLPTTAKDLMQMTLLADWKPTVLRRLEAQEGKLTVALGLRDL